MLPDRLIQKLPRIELPDSHALESANLFISCFMKFARKGIHLEGRKANVVIHVCRNQTSRFAEGTDICLASTEES